MGDLTYIARVVGKTMRSMLAKPNHYSRRAWSSEFTRRLASQLLDAAVEHDDNWLRRKQALLGMKGPDLLKVRSTWKSYAGVSCLELVPKGSIQDSRVIVYFHGGGYVVGSAASYHYTLAKLALANSCRVVGVDYRLLPEFTLEEAQKDCLDVSAHMIAGLPSTTKVVLAGDSAGAALALSTTRALISKQLIARVAGCVLISPWVVPDKPEVLDYSADKDDLLGAAILARWAQTIEARSATPANASFGDLTWEGFPRCYVQAGGSEMFLPQIDSLVKGMQRDGVAVRYEVFPEQFHVFQTLSPLVREAQDAIDKIAEAISDF